jgi:hypothetical protein
MIAKLGNLSALRDAILTDEWVKDAACGGRSDVLEGPDEQAAKALCSGSPLQGIPQCPVIAECSRWVFGLSYKMDPDGVTAGMTLDERATERRAAGKRGRRRAA